MYRAIKYIFLSLAWIFAFFVITFFIYLIFKKPGEFFSNILNPLILVYFAPTIICYWIASWADGKRISKYGPIEEPSTNDNYESKEEVPKEIIHKNNDLKKSSLNPSEIGSGTLVPNEVEAVFKKIDNYLANFGDNKPESVTLNTYDWALIDLSIRKASDNLCSLHTHGWNNLSSEFAIKCQADRCYCHRFLDDPEIREIAKTINNYLVAMGDNIPTSITIDPEAKTKLNNRFNYFFDNAFNLDTNPNLAIQVIRVAGNELYKTNNA